MATLVLTAAGNAAGGNIAGSLGSAIGGKLGSFLGGQLDNRLFGGSLNRVKGGRLEDLAVQSSAYGRMIPLIYGNARIAGNIIWSLPIKEVAVTESISAGGKGGGGVSATETSYQYSITMAIAICEGVIDDALRVWADAKEVNLAANASSYRLYKGSETQNPDPTIESFEGVDKTPAYRGIAYIVVEDFPLAVFGNRIPNFTFEVRKTTAGSAPMEDLVKSLVIIPGSGEFVYDTTIQYKIPGYDAGGGTFIQQGSQEKINQHNRDPLKTDADFAIDQMLATFKNLEWVAVVVTWFGDSLDAGTCVIKPGVEYQASAKTSPDIWMVGDYTRSSARQITLVDGSPRYGGTPNDASLLRYLDRLKAKGIKIMFLPMFFMDMENKPWRGRVTGSSSNVSSFFTKTYGYNAFITHYANLVKNKVDAFAIGSELIGLTKIYTGTTNRSYPAVEKLVDLAETVKGIMGSSVKVTYAADWSEYHHTDDGWYNLDPLWASSNIDFVGIDAYFPLTDAPQTAYDEQKVMDGWVSGEGYEWYYTDGARTTKADLEAKYAWKNIAWWWSNSHVNPNGSTTSWVAESKKIWFCEYGFPSLDGATNQPNVFYDPDSQESSFPRFSKGLIDFRAQRLGIAATEKKWQNSSMVEKKFLWTYDARPYPYWPNLESIWKDGRLWKYGHWVQGKLGVSNLGAIISDLCKKAGLADSDFDVSKLNDLVDGYIITERASLRDAIEELQKAYFFDAVESDNKIKFVSRGGESAVTIVKNDLIPGKNGELFAISRIQELELPNLINIIYFNRSNNYQTGNQYAERLASSSKDSKSINLPIVFGDQTAKQIAEKMLYNIWMERVKYQFMLPIKYLAYEPTDIIKMDMGDDGMHQLRITSLELANPFLLKIQAVREDVSIYQPGNGSVLEATPTISVIDALPKTRLELMDIPALPIDGVDYYLRAASIGYEAAWNGSVLYRSEDGGGNYNRLDLMNKKAIIGNSQNALSSGETDIFDYKNKLTVLLTSGTLASISEIALLNGGNLALLGDEIIQFRNATLIAAGKYELSQLLRGRFGTESFISTHAVGDRFILLDDNISRFNMPHHLVGFSLKYKPVTIGATLGVTTAQDFTYQARALKPYAPVHAKGEKDGSGNFIISWIRRTRISGEWKDYVDVPLNESAEKYELEIMDGANIKRMISASETSVTYTATQQVADFGAEQSSLSVRIYQLSTLVGRGYAYQVTVGG